MSYFIDVQGTLIDDVAKQPIDGAIEFISKLNEQNIPYVVVTNNTKEKSRDFHHFLCSLGFAIPEKNYLDPFMVLNSLVTEKSVCCFGPKSFEDVISSMGFNVKEENPQAVLIASSKDFNSEDYALMIEKVIGGAKLIGMHATSIYAKNSRRYPGVGAILKMLSYATGKEYEIIGKPSLFFYQEALQKLNMQKQGIEFKDVVMISDDGVGDLCGAKDLGIKTTLVLSGKCKDENEILHVRKSIDKIVQNIGICIKDIHG